MDNQNAPLNQQYKVVCGVVNAADYGNAQRRRRTFIFAYRKDTALGETLANHIKEDADYALKETILRDGFFAKAFPIEGGAQMNVNTRRPLLGR